MTTPLVPINLVTSLSIVCFVGFCWALKGHFRCIRYMPAGMRLLSAMSAAAFGSFLTYIWTGSLGVLWPCAVPLFSASLALFIWTTKSTWRTRLTLAFTDDQPIFLLREGPYKYVRHPFYSAYLLFWSGTAAASSDYASWAAGVAIAFVYWLASQQEEEKFSHSELAEAYAAYRAVTGRFVPRVLWMLPMAAVPGTPGPDPALFPGKEALES